jgi:glyoxylase-like metal-dependent hydrolase (beta-lactamase superfamily II)
MRVVSLHPDVLVATSAAWQTTCTIVRGTVADAPAGADGPAAEAFVIDSPVLPSELEVLPTLLAQSGFPFSGLLATHGDWDHLLGRLAFGADAPLGVAETTAARLTAEPGAAARRLREFDQEWYVEGRAPLSLGQVQALPVPGHLDVGDQSLELHPTGGHTADGMAIWIPWARVLVCGDHLSPVELPMLSAGGSRSAYLATLERLRPLVEQADHVVPGHGAVLDAARAMAILREDVAYLTDWTLPIARRDPEQLKLHARNQTAAGD